MLFKVKSTASYATNTMEKATIDKRCFTHRPTNYLLTTWGYHNLHENYDLRVFLSKTKAPTRIILKSPFHYKKPKHRVTTLATTVNTIAQIQVPNKRKPTKLSNVQEIYTNLQLSAAISQSVSASGASMPQYRARATLVLPTNLWS